MQEDAANIKREDYEWVWTVRTVSPRPDEKVPMARGDRLFIKIGDDNQASFHHRHGGGGQNSGLWNKAEGVFYGDTGTLSGSLPDGTTFSMSLSRGGQKSTIRCRHKRNPEQGEWDADDGIGN